MKVKLLYPSVFAGVLGLYFTLLSFQQSPEIKILGEWKEVAWEYEKVDSELGSEMTYNLTEQIKSQLIGNLIIHEAEVWKFLDDDTLEMKGINLSKSLQWKLKGRGDILQIQGDSNVTEYYQIQMLNEDRMVLHFNFDMQVRGIVKMTFERINA